MRILVVEDETTLLKIIKKRLAEDGYSVDTCDNGDDGRYFIESTPWDCIVLDIMLPGVDGLTLLQEMRQKGNKTPVLLLTARDTIGDRVAGLDSGADDYLVKPFAFDELLARIRVLIRRQSGSPVNELRIGDLSVDVASRRVIRGGRQIELTTKEYAVLEYMMHNQDRVITRGQIAAHVWNYDFDCSSNIVDVYIRYLRSKVDEPFDKKLIHTIRGSGYVLREK